MCVELFSLFYSLVCVFIILIKESIHILLKVLRPLINNYFGAPALCVPILHFSGLTALALLSSGVGRFSWLIMFMFLCWCLVLWNYDVRCFKVLVSGVVFDGECWCLVLSLMVAAPFVFCCCPLWMLSKGAGFGVESAFVGWWVVEKSGARLGGKTERGAMGEKSVNWVHIMM